jgi:hypothetical protein
VSAREAADHGAEILVKVKWADMKPLLGNPCEVACAERAERAVQSGGRGTRAMSEADGAPDHVLLCSGCGRVDAFPAGITVGSLLGRRHRPRPWAPGPLPPAARPVGSDAACERVGKTAATSAAAAQQQQDEEEDEEASGLKSRA